MVGVYAGKVGCEYISAFMQTICQCRQPTHTAALSAYGWASVSNIVSSWCQYEALRFVSFPTQVLAKACKVIPVMLMGRCVSGRTYPLHQYGTATVVCVGVAMFMWSSR
jgi:adenosine 3'-phospho 5'-phosphosulfate transporter B2